MPCVYIQLNTVFRKRFFRNRVLLQYCKLHVKYYSIGTGAVLTTKIHVGASFEKVCSWPALVFNIWSVKSPTMRNSPPSLLASLLCRSLWISQTRMLFSWFRLLSYWTILLCSKFGLPCELNFFNSTYRTYIHCTQNCTIKIHILNPPTHF